MNKSAASEGAPALGIAIAAGEARIWGMTGSQRLERQFRRAGLGAATLNALPAAAAGVLIARADWVFDESLIKALAKRDNAVLVGPDGQAVAVQAPLSQVKAAAAALEAGENLAGYERLDPSALAYNEELRKRETPVLEPLSADTVRAVEARTFKGSYKGVTDLVTKHFWPVPARIVTRWCALAGISPNQVTLAGLLLVFAAFYLFWTGQFGWGLACAWVMTFLDTVDGKLARVTLTSSKLGGAFDHAIDLIHPPFWWWAWFAGVLTIGQTIPAPGWMLGIVLIGYWAQRVQEGIFLGRFKFHIHGWRPFDSLFRQVTARRNPNLILLTAAALIGRPDLGFVAVAAWTAVSLAVHQAQLTQALFMPRARVTSWLAR